MIVLDTNVVSELAWGPQNRSVVLWARAQAQQVVTTSLTRAEIAHGVSLLPLGRRRAELESAVQSFLDTIDCLPLTIGAADLIRGFPAELSAGRRSVTVDQMIAATCIDVGATLATRDVHDFAGYGITLVNPWDHT